MTVKEMLDTKYLEMLKTLNKTSWENIKAQRRHPAETMYKAIEITVTDIRDNGGWSGELWQEIDRMHKAKLLASNKHRQNYGAVTKYWLTEKGWRALNKDHSIC